MVARAAVSSVAAEPEPAHETGTEILLTILSVAIGLAGIGLGWVVFLKKPIREMPPLLENKYYVDEFYDAAVVEPIEQTSRFFLWKVVDVKIIDGFVNWVARGFSGLADTMRYTQTGFARNYAAVILIGAILIIGYFGYIALR
jgi:NADH-quinone oxidoreductase subunit L